MKIYGSLLLIFLSLVGQANDLAIVKKSEKWGVIDAYGKLVIPCEYDFLEITCSELIAAKKNNRFGFIDRNNTIRIAFDYDSCSGFYEQKAIVKKNGKAGFINENNQLIINYTYEEALRFSYGLAAVKIGNVWGFINEQGAIAIPPAYDLIIDNFHDQYCLVNINGHIGLINRSGSVVIPFEFDYLTRFVEHSNELIIAYQYPCTYRLLKVKDNVYNDVVKRKFDGLNEYRYEEYNDLDCEQYPSSPYLLFSIAPYNSDCGIDGNYEWKNCRGNGVMTKDGKEILCATDRVKFLDPTHFLCYWKNPRDTDDYHIADGSGSLVDFTEYVYLGPFQDSIITVFNYTRGNWGGVNLQNKVVIPFIYDDILMLHNNMMIVEKNYKLYVTTVNGDYTSSPLSYPIYKVTGHDHIIVFRPTSERKYGIMDYKGNVLHEPQFDEPVHF